VDNLICNELHQLFQAKEVTSKGNKHLLYSINSPRFYITVNVIQLAQLKRTIKQIKMSLCFLPQFG